MVNYDPLYKRTATGAVQVWWGEVDDNRYRVHFGQEDGVITTSDWTETTGKNKGRSNETTAEEQAHLEMEALYTKKQNQGGYWPDRSMIDSKPKYFKPMLARSYDDVQIEFPVASQPKLDGVRCIATIDGLWSRTGKPLVATPHIHMQLSRLFDQYPDLILDGELYADKFADNFNAIISLVRKTRPTAHDIAESERHIEYHVYDIPSVEEPFDTRFLALHAAVNQLPSLTAVKVVSTTLGVMRQDALDKLYADYIEKGYEGQIIRKDAPYEAGKRSKNLIKRKEFITEEFRLVRINEGKGNRSGKAGFITYELPDGRTFDSGLRGSWEEATELLVNADDYMGGLGTVRFFGYTPDGIPRFPITVALYPEGREL